VQTAPRADAAGVAGSGGASGLARVRGMVQVAAQGPMFRGAASMMACVAIQGSTNLVFVGLASKTYSEHDVGIASALFTATLLVTFVTGMGLVVTVPLYANRSDRDDATVLTWVFVYTTVTSLVGSVLYLALVPTEAIVALRNDLGAGGWVLFVLTASGISIATLTDVRMMADRKWNLIIIRNIVMGVGRVAALAVPAFSSPAMFVFVAGSVPPALTGAVAVGVLPRLSGIRYRLFPIPRRLWEALHFATVNWFGVLVSQGPLFLVPVVVSAKVSSASYAEFFVAWQPAQLALAIPTTMASVLLAESSKQEQSLRKKVIEALGLSIVLVAILVAGAAVMRGPVNAFYGKGKYPDVVLLLLLLLGAGIPFAVSAIGLSLARVRRDQFVILGTTITGGIAEMALVVVLVDRNGTSGAAIGWLLGNTVAAAAVVVTSIVSLRRRGVGAEALDQLVDGQQPFPDEELVPTGAGQMEPIGFAGFADPPSGAPDGVK